MSTHNRPFVHGMNISEIDIHEVICEPKALVYSGSIWFGGNPFKSLLPILMLQIFLFFASSRMVQLLLRPLRQPKFVSDIIGGIILGPSALGRSERFNQIVFPEKAMFISNTMAVMGIVYFIFLIGVKMDKNLILNPRKKAYRIGAISLVVPFVLVGFMSYLLQRPLAGLVQGHFFLFLAASLSITAFPVLALALEELNLLTSELGKLAMPSSMINDMIGWFFMGLFVALHQRNSINSLRAIASTTLLITFITHVLRPCIILIDKITPAGRLVDRVYVVAILITVLFLSLLSNMVGASAVDAPLVLGIVIPEGSPLGASIVERTETVVGQILLPLFFVRCGLAVDVFKITDMTAFAALEFVVFMGYVGKLAATVLISLYCRVSIRHSLSLGLIMNIRGLVEVITFIHWRSQKFIDDQCLAILVLSTLSVTAVVVPLLTTLYKPPRYFATHTHRAIQNAQPNDEFRILACVHCEENVYGVISLLEASHPTEESPICAYVLHLVELVGRYAAVVHKTELPKCGSKQSDTDHIVSAFKKYSDDSNGTVYIQPFTVISPYRTMHEDICTQADDNRVALIIIPFRNNYSNMASGRSSALSNLNLNVLVGAPCSVGILVDHDYRRPALRSQHFSFKALLIFLGGADDRETLAYANRMSYHPGVSITVIRFRLSNGSDNSDDYEAEKKLDESVLLEFQFKSMNKQSVFYHESVAADEGHVLPLIGSLEDDYDLIMVGRRHRTTMADWRESTELGFLGDKLLSSNLVSKIFSLLVVQRCEAVNSDPIIK